MQKKVMVAMSGGVDSSVSALLLKEQGYDITGVTMCLGINHEGDSTAKCCGPKEIEDAKAVCRELGVPHFVFDFAGLLQEKVIKKFISEYLKGRTPNPCVECNKYLKFGNLYAKAKAMDFDFIATGHYAKIQHENGQYFMTKPKDIRKDQTYFLYSIPSECLSSILFPLADYTKDEVRELAKKSGLPVAEKKESQDICFVSPEKTYDKLILESGNLILAGDIVHTDGEVLGRHNGIIYYTIGQRQGLGIAYKKPLYVTKIDVLKNQVIVSDDKTYLQASGLIADDLNFHIKNFDFSKDILVKIRYASKPVKASLSFQDDSKDSAKIIFHEKQESITQGQAVVFYTDAKLIGGGVIKEAIL
jgi:tRNA-specific 2-thiouridylase